MQEPSGWLEAQAMPALYKAVQGWRAKPDSWLKGNRQAWGVQAASEVRVISQLGNAQQLHELINLCLCIRLLSHGWGGRRRPQVGRGYCRSKGRVSRHAPRWCGILPCVSLGCRQECRHSARLQAIARKGSGRRRLRPLCRLRRRLLPGCWLRLLLLHGHQVRLSYLG